MKRILLGYLLGATFALDAQAVMPLPAPDDVQAEAWQRWSEEFSREMRSTFGTMFGSRMVSGKVVKGAPYSAEIVTETNQTLADGNVISRKTTGRVYRDTVGRTRQESGAGKDLSVFINDPVAGNSIVLNPGTRRAIVNPRAHVFTSSNRQVVKVDGTEVRVEDGRVFVDGRQVGDGSSAVAKSHSGKEVRVENGKVFIDGSEIGTASPARRVTVKRIDSGDGTHREEVRVQVIRSGDGHDLLLAPVPPTPPAPPMPPGAVHAPLAPLPPMPGISTLRFESTARLGKGVTANLGTKDVEGVRAQGKSTTWTIPAGEIGNRHPINIVSESWYSPDLQLTVYSRYSDPRTGESLYRLAGIKRAEPAAELFTTPEGYTINDRARERESRRKPG